MTMASRSPNCSVQPSKRLGGWEVVQAGHKRASAFAEKKSDAMKMARSMVRHDGGGEVRIKNSMGKVVESKTVRGNPFQRRRAA